MANEQLASLVRSTIEQLTERWMRAVRSDSRIDSDSGLSRLQLRDHIPAILEQICELISADETPGPTNTLEGRVTVFLRLQQGYPGKEVVREISLLRLTILDFLVDECAELAGISLAKYHRVARIIDLYMDEIMRNAISIYSEGNST